MQPSRFVWRAKKFVARCQYFLLSFVSPGATAGLPDVDTRCRRTHSASGLSVAKIAFGRRVFTADKSAVAPDKSAVAPDKSAVAPDKSAVAPAQIWLTQSLSIQFCGRVSESHAA